MLSAHKLGPKGVEYYVSYAGRGLEGYWLGKAAASLGLVGAVDPAAFRALAKGEHPDGGRLLERVATGHTPGWDVTLSAPKSVSLAWALADEPLRAALAEAHRGAVKAAFSFLEDEGGRARRGFGGRDGHVPAGLAIACFVHPASRELDPQLHTHGIVCNVVEGSDGRWTALDSRMIYLHRRAAASIYRAELRERVAELGGQWLTPDRRGLSELDGFDRDVLRSFSQRRNAIEAELERTGRSGPRASEAACLKTRRDKLDVELVELRDTWAERARALGVTRETVTALLDGTDRRVAPTAAEVATARSELVGSAGLTRAQAAFTRDDVIVAWAERCTQGARRGELEELADDTLADPAVVPLVVADETGRPLTTDRPRDSHTIVRLVRAPASGIATLACALRYSTTEMLNTESRLLALGRAGLGKACGVADAVRLEAVLADRRDLSFEQAAMVRSLCSSGNGVEVVIGVPGSGKTFALDAARRAWQSSGYRVYGAALAAEAAAQLEAGSRISSVTLDRLLYELSAPQHLAQHSLDPRSIVVVDEASMVDTRRLVRLLEIAARAGAKVVLTGDDRQLPSVEAGGGFGALGRELGATRLGSNARQVAEWERAALDALREGRAGEAAAAYSHHGRVRRSTNPSELIGEMVERWWVARESGDDAVLYAYARDAVRVLNGLARRHVEVAGRLSGPELTVEEFAPADLAPRTYRVGDELCCLRNRSRLGAGRDPSGKGVRNGTRGTVRAIDCQSREVTLETSDGRSVRLPADYVKRSTDYGYAWTLHKGQGQTVGQAPRSDAGEVTRRRGRAFVFGAEGLSAEAALVGASRATDSTELFVLTEPDETASTGDWDEELGRAWSRSEQQRLALDELETGAEIARLARTSREALGYERDTLVSLIGAGPAVDLTSRQADASRELGISLVQRDEAHEEVGVFATMSATSEGIERRNLQGRYTAARRRLGRAERDVTEAAELSEAADAALSAQQSVRAVLGTDLRSALDRLEIVDSALATLRRREIAAWSSEPPEYVVALLGPRPTDQDRAQRWQQGTVEIEDWRRFVGVTDGSNSPNAWTRALGLPIGGWEGRRRRRVVANLMTVRRDLGLDEGERARAVNGGPLLDPATTAVLARGKSNESPSFPRLRGAVQLGRGR